ncbi:MAG: hypothetical protein FWF87_04000 [Synergistaceae bacterium]|nr:hypothetical protein [Synergistaceae bacterium]
MTQDNIRSGKYICSWCKDIVPEGAEICPKCGLVDFIRVTDDQTIVPNAELETRVRLEHKPKDNMTTYKIWAPDTALWTKWAKPVLFASLTSWKDDYALDIPEIDWIASAQRDTMVIVDLPGKTGVEESLALARLGFRPVPLYNGVNDEKPVAITNTANVSTINADGALNAADLEAKTPRATGETSAMLVDAKEVADALYKGAYTLETLRIPDNAPPVFMLDSRRMTGLRAPGKYDNRWCIFQQDMPSASFLSEQRINKIIVRTDKLQDDLLHILCRYQEQKIKIMQSVGDKVMDMVAAKPSWAKSLFFRFNVILGLTRNFAGGFGGKIPEPGSGGG